MSDNDILNVVLGLIGLVIVAAILIIGLIMFLPNRHDVRMFIDPVTTTI